MSLSQHNLTRYLRNFDPINESMFRQQQQQQSDTSVRLFQENQPDRAKQIQELTRINTEQENKIHMLAEHVSALEFENQQMSELLKKNKKKRKEPTETFNIIYAFIKEFSTLYQDSSERPSCSSFRRLINSNVCQSEPTVDTLAQWMLALFEQIDYQNQISCNFQDKIEQLQEKLKSQVFECERLKNDKENLQNCLKCQLTEENEEQSDHKIKEILKISIPDLTIRLRVTQFIDEVNNKNTLSRQLQQLNTNLKRFVMVYRDKAQDEQYEREIEFKEAMIEKCKRQISNATVNINKSFKSITSMLHVRNKENQDMGLSRVGSKHIKMTVSQSHTNCNSANKNNILFISSDKNETMTDRGLLTRDNSLAKLKKKISDAESLSRMVQNRCSLKLL